MVRLVGATGTAGSVFAVPPKPAGLLKNAAPSAPFRLADDRCRYPNKAMSTAAQINTASVIQMKVLIPGTDGRSQSALRTIAYPHSLSSKYDGGFAK